MVRGRFCLGFLGRNHHVETERIPRERFSPLADYGPTSSCANGPRSDVETWERRGCSFITPVNEMNAPDAADARAIWMATQVASKSVAVKTAIASYASATRFRYARAGPNACFFVMVYSRGLHF
jgi:hypothetical protein